MNLTEIKKAETAKRVKEIGGERHTGTQKKYPMLWEKGLKIKNLRVPILEEKCTTLKKVDYLNETGTERALEGCYWFNLGVHSSTDRSKSSNEHFAGM